MPMLSITWRQPGLRVVVVIVIVVYIATFHPTPYEAISAALGSLLGELLAIEPARSPQSQSPDNPEVDR